MESLTQSISSSPKPMQMDEINKERRKILMQSDDERLEIKRKEYSENSTYYLRRYGVAPKFIDCSFENFDGYKNIADSFKNYANEKPLPNLLITGKCGCGKTHLAVAVLRQLIISGRTVSMGEHGWPRENEVRFIQVPEILLEIRRSFSGDYLPEDEIIRKYASMDFLVLDDLGAEKISDWSIATFYLILDRRYRAMRPTLITSNLKIDEIELTFNTRIASRLSEGKITNLDLPDYRKKRK